jgi:MFS family permease
LSFDLRGAMGTRTFWILIASTGMWSMIGTGLVFHLDALLASRGLTTAEAAWATPIMATCMAAMQLAGGRIADRAAPGRLAAAALVLVTGACTAFALGHGAMLVAAYGVYGLGQGLMSLVNSTVWARYFGRPHLGKIRGTALASAISASAVGPLVLGACAVGAIAAAVISPWAVRPDVCATDANDAEEFGGEYSSAAALTLRAAA